MDPRLLEILACPICKGLLRHDRSTQELLCEADRLAYPIREGIPVMMVDQARQLDMPSVEERTRAAPDSPHPPDQAG